jgi:hypothetical protein
VEAPIVMPKRNIIISSDDSEDDTPIIVHSKCANPQDARINQLAEHVEKIDAEKRKRKQRGQQRQVCNFICFDLFI